VGHSNGVQPHAQPKAVLGEGALGGYPLLQWGFGVSPGENFEIANAKSCILDAFSALSPRDLRPWMEAMHSMRVRRELPRKIGACGGLEPYQTQYGQYDSNSEQRRMSHGVRKKLRALLKTTTLLHSKYRLTLGLGLLA